MKWSLSALKTFESCAFKYKLKYIDKLEEVRSDKASRGVVIHADIENYIKDTGGVKSKIPEHLSFYKSFLDHIKGQEFYAEKTIRLSKEWKEIKEGEEHWYKGILDLLVIGSRGQDKDPTEATIYDWKTGKIYPDHDDQKTLYSVAVFSLYPTLFSVRAIHVYVDLGKNRETTYHRDQMHNMRKLWENRVEKLASAVEFLPQPSYACRWCAFSRFNKGPCKF